MCDGQLKLVPTSRFSFFEFRFSQLKRGGMYNSLAGCMEGTALSEAVKLTAMVKAAG
jgi:hypothetical protein